MLVRGGPLPAAGSLAPVGQDSTSAARVANRRLPERGPESSLPANAAIRVPPARGLVPTR